MWPKLLINVFSVDCEDAQSFFDRTERYCQKTRKQSMTSIDYFLQKKLKTKEKAKNKVNWNELTMP